MIRTRGGRQWAEGRRERKIAFRELLKNAGVALVALAGALACAELGLRLFAPQPLAEHYGAPPAGGPLMRIDPELGWKLRTNVAGLKSDESWQSDVRTNALGFRDAERARKASGVTRVAVLGDSFVFGSGVLQDETLAHQLAVRLGPSFEVVNLGVPGYGTDQALLTLRRWGPRLAPDVVLAGFFWNDVMENASGEIYAMKKPRFVLEKGALTLLPPGVPRRHSAWAFLDAALEGRSHLWSLAGRALDGVRDEGTAEERPVMLDLSLRAAPPFRSAEFELTWALLYEMAREARALGAAPLVFTIPPRYLADDVVKGKVLKVYGLSGDALDPDGFFRVKAACAARNVPLVDLLPPFRAAATAGESLYLSAAGIHWSAAGHALAARALEAPVRAAASRGAAPAAPSPAITGRRSQGPAVARFRADPGSGSSAP